MQLKLDSSLPLSRLCCMICLFHNILFQYISLVGYSLVCPFQFFTDDTWWFIHDTFPPSCKECLAKLTSESYRSICNVVIHGPNLTFVSIEDFHHQIIFHFFQEIITIMITRTTIIIIITNILSQPYTNQNDCSRL